VAEDRIDLLRKECRQHFERLMAEAVESREINRMMIAALERQAELLVAVRDEMLEAREDIRAQRRGFLSLIDELKRHGLGGSGPAPA